MTVLQQERVIALSSDVTDAINKLSEISFDLKSCEDNSNSLVCQYKKQLELICASIDQSIYIGLVDLMLIYGEGLDVLIKLDRQLSEDEIEFLHGFPEHFLNYLDFPASKIPAIVLVKYFKNPNWVRPVSQDEYQLQMSYIAQYKTGEENNMILLDDILSAQGDESNAMSQESEQKVQDINELMPAIDDSVARDPDVDDQPGEESQESGDIGLDINELISISDEYVAQDPDVDDQSNEDSLSSNDNVLSIDQLITLSDDFTDQGKQQSPPIDDVVSLDQFIAEPEEVPIEEFSASMNDVQEPGSASVQSPDLELHQQELIDLVGLELVEIIENSNELTSLDVDAVKHEMIAMAEQAENISNAINLIGLEGLARASEIISSNLTKLSQSENDIGSSFFSLIIEWPKKLSDCLKNIYDEVPMQSLIKYLEDKDWPEPVDAILSQQLNEKLRTPSFVEEEVESRQIIAEPDDVSLELPVDVNQELLEGLLQDLPAQTEEFSTAIHHLCDGGGLADIEVAQRIAHTLKGAANVVGVKGIANLTHHLEDILEAQVKVQALPVQPLLDAIMNASDCLEAMTEALLGLDVAPDDALQTLQNILDWANRLDKEGLSDSDDKAYPVYENKSESKEAPQVTKKNLKESQQLENMLRIPTTLADELLRLAGESLISTGQVQEHIKSILIKQDLIQLHNQSLQQLSYDMEHVVDIQGLANQLNINSGDSDFDPLEMDQYNELHSVSRRLIEIAADSVQLTNTLDNELTNLSNLVIEQNQLQKESQELVLRTRMVPAKNIIPRIRRGVRQACRLTGKQVELHVEDNDTYMDNEVLNDLIEPLMHLIRNAVDHGIESEDTRQKAGKSEKACIYISFVRLGNQMVIKIEDNGKGLNLEQIKSKAITKGLINSESEISDDAITRLILEPGFSTRDEVTQTSGRGIGLDVVSVKIRELKGSINIFSELGQKCRFELTLPVSSFSTHSLLIRVRQHIYAISNRGVEEILYPGLGELSDIGDEMIFQIEDQAYGAVLIDDLFKLPQDRRKIERSSRPILLVREESGARTAILVQEVLDSRDVVVKPMGKYLPKLSGIAGATVLGDGSVAPVIDLPELLQHKITHGQNQHQSSLENTVSVPRLPYVLVVDDSLSARQSLAQFVQDLGLDVRTARDGMEAVSLIEARQPDLILVDMEMPRMNGLELTSHIRASANTSDMPVIMITSRSTDKHREAAIKKGVNHFMVKPFAEDELAQHINDVLDIAL